MSEEPVRHSVGQHAEARGRHAEIPVELRGGLLRQVGTVVLALEQHDWRAVRDYGVVDLLALLRAHVGREFRHHLVRVEHVEPEHVRDERQDQGGLRRLLRLDAVESLRNPAGHLADAVGQVHPFE